MTDDDWWLILMLMPMLLLMLIAGFVADDHADAKQMSRWPDADADSDDDAVTPRSNLHRADLLPGPSLVVGLNSKEAQAWFSSQRSAH